MTVQVQKFGNDASFRWGAPSPQSISRMPEKDNGASIAQRGASRLEGVREFDPPHLRGLDGAFSPGKLPANLSAGKGLGTKNDPTKTAAPLGQAACL